MKKVIVTGANGFVGGALTKELVSHGIEVIALDMEGHNDNLPQSNLVKFYSFSLDNVMELQSKIVEKDIDTFYHFIILLGLDQRERQGRIQNYN